MTRILVLSGTASAINYIRSFAGDPTISLHVSDSDPYCPGLYAPNVTPHLLPRARDTTRYRVALDQVVRDEAIEVLIPTSDYDVEGVVQYLHDGWSPDLLLFRPSLGALRTLGNKGSVMARLSERLPAVVPRTCTGADGSGGLDFPVVVKPTAESGGKGVAVVRGAEELDRAIGRIREFVGDQFVIQEFIPGRTYVSTLVYDHAGALAAAVGMRSDLTFFTWGGGGCAGHMVDEPDILRLADAVVRECGGWRGPINLEWRRHERTGAFYLMEVNCRLNGYSYLTTMNGVCLPRVVLALLTGAPLPSLSEPAKRDRNFILGFRETLVDRSWAHPES